MVGSPNIRDPISINIEEDQQEPSRRAILRQARVRRPTTCERMWEPASEMQRLFYGYQPRPYSVQVGLYRWPEGRWPEGAILPYAKTLGDWMRAKRVSYDMTTRDAPFGLGTIHRHLMRSAVIGTSLGSVARAICLDLDLPIGLFKWPNANDYRMAREILHQRLVLTTAWVRARGGEPMVETSQNTGYHLFALLSRAVPAELLRVRVIEDLGEWLMDHGDPWIENPIGIDIFPDGEKPICLPFGMRRTCVDTDTLRKIVPRWGRRPEFILEVLGRMERGSIPIENLVPECWESRHLGLSPHMCTSGDAASPHQEPPRDPPADQCVSQADPARPAALPAQISPSGVPLPAQEQDSPSRSPGSLGSSAGGSCRSRSSSAGTSSTRRRARCLALARARQPRVEVLNGSTAAFYEAVELASRAFHGPAEGDVETAMEAVRVGLEARGYAAWRYADVLVAVERYVLKWSYAGGWGAETRGELLDLLGERDQGVGESDLAFGTRCLAAATRLGRGLGSREMRLLIPGRPRLEGSCGRDRRRVSAYVAVVERWRDLAHDGLVEYEVPVPRVRRGVYRARPGLLEAVAVMEARVRCEAARASREARERARRASRWVRRSKYRPAVTWPPGSPQGPQAATDAASGGDARARDGPWDGPDTGYM